MSVIQKIQEKYAKLMAIIIALALIMFVVMLAFENGGSLFSGAPGGTVGKVNGQTISQQDFATKIDQEEAFLKSQGYPDGAFLRQQALDQAWNREVSRLLLNTEIEKLGMQVGNKELGDILYGENAPQGIRQNFTDPKTGQFNAQAAKQAIDQQMKAASPEQKAAMNEEIRQMEFGRLAEKYSSLMSNSTNFPKWLIENENADASQIARASVVREFYASIPDSSVKVTDKEIENYISKRKSEFKQEESRGIAYVSFSALPTAADSAATLQKLDALKAAFDTTKEVKMFLESQGIQNYYEGFINGNKIQVPFKDSIFRQPVNGIYGPYIDGSNYTLAKMIGVRTQSDTVTVRHILVSFEIKDPESGQTVGVRDTATAYKLADSIRTAIAAGSSFDSLCIKLSDDPGKIDRNTGSYTGGKYENVTAGSMVPSFNDYILGNPAGSKGIVKTDFGYHYIEILSTKGSSVAYKIAYLPQPIEASTETDRMASNEATVFASESRNQKEFDASVEKWKAKGVNKMYASDITPTASQIMGLGASRQLVKSIYDADLGDVLEPERVDDNYVVAMVTEINKKGTMSVNKARMMVEPILRNEKKAELIKTKIGTVNNLEEVATKLNKSIETADSIRFKGTPNPVIGPEAKVIGAIFNGANRGKVVPEAIAGNSGVYVVRVDAVSATPVADANVAEQRQQRYQQAKMRNAYPQQALMESATIKDNRGKVF